MMKETLKRKMKLVYSDKIIINEFPLHKQLSAALGVLSQQEKDEKVLFLQTALTEIEDVESKIDELQDESICIEFVASDHDTMVAFVDSKIQNLNERQLFCMAVALQMIKKVETENGFLFY